MFIGRKGKAPEEAKEDRCALLPSGRGRSSSTRSNTSWVVESEEGKAIIPGRREEVEKE